MLVSLIFKLIICPAIFQPRIVSGSRLNVIGGSMTGVGEGAGIATKALEVVKDLPLWLLTGLAVSAGILLFLPGVAPSIPGVARPWILITGVVAAVLAASRGIAVLIHAVPSWRASADARRKFHLTGVPQQSHWSTAKQADDSIITQISAHLFVRNRTADPLALVGVRLVSPRIRGEVVHADISVRAEDRNMYGSAIHSGYFVPPGMSLPASAHLLIRGVLRRKLGNEVKVRLAVSDDEGHEQRVTLRMRVLPPAPVVAVTPSVEIVSSISDPIEKEVAAVLQAELARYDKHGRTVGGLGSIHLAANGQAIASLAGDSWNPNSPKNQSISDNPGSVEIRSDNLDALMSYYGRLTSQAERDHFASALLTRMDGKGYLRVTYFIVYALWKIGRLPEALQKAKADLPQGEMKAFGISNTLMLFNGLLRYRHTDFNNQMLDELEKFVIGLNEHPFQIPEKIAAIRTLRLRAST